MHGWLRGLIKQATGSEDHEGYSAHVLLNALHVDLLEDMLASGLSRDDIRGAQASFARAVIDDGRHT